VDFVDTEAAGGFSDFFEVRVDLVDACRSVAFTAGSAVSDSDGTVSVRVVSDSDPLTSPLDHETSGGPGLAGISGLAGTSGLAGGTGSIGCAGAGCRSGGIGVTCRTGGRCGVTGFCREGATRRGVAACGAGVASAGVMWVMASPGPGSAGGGATIDGAAATCGVGSACSAGDTGAGCDAGAAGPLAGAGAVAGELATMSASAGTLAPGVAGAVPRRTCPGSVRRSCCWCMTMAVNAPTTTTAIASRITNSFVERVHRKFIQVPPGSTPTKFNSELLEHTVKVGAKFAQAKSQTRDPNGQHSCRVMLNPSQ
jgi:hypothetical protein